MVDAGPCPFSLADDEGIGRYEWAWVGLAVSSGGAFRTFLGMFDTGGAWRTSFFSKVSTNQTQIQFNINPTSPTYPAGIGIKEPPENAVVQDFLHSSTPVQEHSQHALPQLYDSLVFFCLGRFCRIIRHGMLLGYRRYDQSGVKVNQRRAQRGKLGVPTPYFKSLDSVSVPEPTRHWMISYARIDCVGDVAPAALHVLSRVRDQYGRCRVLVEPLLDSTVISALLGHHLLLALWLLVVVNIAHGLLGDVLGRIVAGRGLSRRWGCGTVGYYMRNSVSWDDRDEVKL